MLLIKGLAGNSRMKGLKGINAKELERKLMSFIPALHEAKNKIALHEAGNWGRDKKVLCPVF